MNLHQRLLVLILLLLAAPVAWWLARGLDDPRLVSWISVTFPVRGQRPLTGKVIRGAGEHVPLLGASGAKPPSKRVHPARLTNQAQDALRKLVGLRQHRVAGLEHDVQFREVHYSIGRASCRERV